MTPNPFELLDQIKLKDGISMTLVHITHFEIDGETGNGKAEFSDGDVIEFTGIKRDVGFITKEDTINHHRELMVLQRIGEFYGLSVSSAYPSGEEATSETRQSGKESGETGETEG